MARLVAGWVAAALGLAAIAVVLGGLIGANSGWLQPEQGVTIFVESNGFHTGLILPAQADGIDWHALFPPTDTADPRYHPTGATDHIAIGWGQRDFFLGTPEWEALTLANTLPALVGSDRTVVHIYHLNRPLPGHYVRPIRVTPAQYRALAGAIQQSVALPAAGALEPIPGYGGDDVFYEGRGRYTLINSCNEWTGGLLRDIGVRIGVWTPTAGTVMRWFPLAETRKP